MKIYTEVKIHDEYGYRELANSVNGSFEDAVKFIANYKKNYELMSGNMQIAHQREILFFNRDAEILPQTSITFTFTRWFEQRDKLRCKIKKSKKIEEMVEVDGKFIAYTFGLDFDAKYFDKKYGELNEENMMKFVLDNLNANVDKAIMDLVTSVDVIQFKKNTVAVSIILKSK